ncbi:MAG: septum formation protein Maf [Bacteroidales bacterium]|jgi:septum formation protein|nr:septum formation protein Maf [Bacteroidales bacterium]
MSTDNIETTSKPAVVSGITKLLLASNSPRRKELLAGLDIPMEVVRLKNIDETHPAGLEGGDIPLHIARLKMSAYDLVLAKGEVLVTADTIVWCDGEEMGKPRDREDAMRMLHKLSGRTHQVYTGVCLKSAVDETSFVCRTDVTFATLTDEQIAYYVDFYKPFDKAGAYGIQEWIGYVGCTRLEGSYFNVMGLPVQRLFTAIQKLKIQ